MDETNWEKEWETRKKKEKTLKVRVYLRKRNFGITQKKYNEMLEIQNEGCKICGKKQETRSLAVDHDHKTGKVRGLLCTACNLALGMVHDDIDVLQQMISYLKT